MSRLSDFGHHSITVLLVTGFYNFLRINSAYVLKGTPYHALFGVKVLLAFGIFALASFLVGRSNVGQKLRANAGKWLTVLVTLVLLVLLLSSTLKNLGVKPKTADSIKPTAVDGGNPAS